ncbi:MAG: hypothetical protein QOG64_1298 [Acidimicrobiaceae bacterium]|nr:hypothetical protein [Acidimicrobiaceae bacterium]
MAGRARPLAALVCVAMGFIAIVAVRGRPASPQVRLPRRYQLAALIERQRTTTADLERQVGDLRHQVADLRTSSSGSRQSSDALEQQVLDANVMAGLEAMKGPGVKVTLDDSTLDKAPTGNVNDLVIHSQDVQGVVNALWGAGAEAIAVNGQRVVGTSAVLCVGNTLLVNGSVYSPPYEVTALGASEERFEDDRLVSRLHRDADAFGLRFSVSRDDHLKVAAFSGVTAPHFARPVR